MRDDDRIRLQHMIDAAEIIAQFFSFPRSSVGMPG
jgi:hypothetical protein